MSGRNPSRALAGVGLAIVVGTVVGLMSAMTFASYDAWTGAATAVVLIGISAPLLFWAVSKEDDQRIAVLIPLALVAKLAAAAVRYYVAFDVYGGTADASMYIRWGNDLAEYFRLGIFDVDVGRERFIGTGFMRYLVGLVFAATGVTGLGGFMVFSWLGFWGLYGFYRAFKLAVPDGDHLRYALLVFFLPSVLYWPSSVGKEAWMLAMLGLTAYGSARLLTRSYGGYITTALGIVGLAMLRPHIAVLAAVGIFAGYLWRSRKAGTTPLFGPVPQIIGVVVLVGGTVALLQQAEEFFDIEETANVAESAETALERTAAQTGQGGSQFEAGRADSPLDLPRAIATVLFRPYPWEAANFQTLVTSMEGMLLMALFLFSWRRVWAGLKQAVRNPYLRFAMCYSLMFIVAYTAVGNFGILARQRVQVFPFVLVLLAVNPRAQEAVQDLRDRLPVRSPYV